MEFSIYSSDYKLVSTGLTKSMVLYLFIEKGAGKKGAIIRDSCNFDMNFNEFCEFYAPFIINNN